VPGIRQLAESLCAALAGFEPGRYSGGDCANLAELFATTAKACQTASARAALRAAECGAHRERGSASAAEWLARASGSSAGEAKAALDTVRAVDACPETKDALVAGAVSLAQAGEIAAVPEHEAALLQIARTSSLGALKNEARRLRLEAVDPDELYAGQRAAREVVHWRDRLGLVCFRGALPPDSGIPFVNRLDAETDREWRAAKREQRLETRAAHAADAFVRMLAGRGKGKARSADLVLVVDLRAYQRGHAHPGELNHIVGGGPIPVRVARELAKDAFLKVVLHEGVNIHTVAHFGRYRPAELDTALELGGPPGFDAVNRAESGCDRRFGLQWDHKDPVGNGGPTSAENFQPLCLPHHGDKTERDRKAGRLGKRPP
jgi:hypothetical protein